MTSDESRRVRMPADPVTAHTFLLCRNDHHVTADGVVESYDSSSAAAEALHQRRQRAIVGAIPFDVRGVAALTAPARLSIQRGPWRASPTSSLPEASVVGVDPEPAEHSRRVAETVALLTKGDNALRKVVLARSLTVRSRPTSPWEIAANLRRADPTGSVFVADLSAAGPGHRGAYLVGASPEVLIRKRGPVVTCHPLAGSTPRSSTPSVDAERGRLLAQSAKDLDEHRFVVNAIAAALAPLCRDLEMPAEPRLVTTPTMWHLGTPIRGQIADPSITALDLALAVHPTPAVCGTPTEAARDHILATEGDRGFYAGTVGWADIGERGDGGDGEWMVSIRCAQLGADAQSVITWAGGGIVAQSSAEDELSETTAKFATILAAFDLT